jgi:hypothetical protein
MYNPYQPEFLEYAELECKLVSWKQNSSLKNVSQNYAFSFINMFKNRNISVRPRKKVRLIEPSLSTHELLRCPIQCTSCCIFRFNRLAVLLLQQTHTFSGFAYSQNYYCDLHPSRGSFLVQSCSRLRITHERKHFPASLTRQLPGYHALRNVVLPLYFSHFF